MRTYVRALRHPESRFAKPVLQVSCCNGIAEDALRRCDRRALRVSAGAVRRPDAPRTCRCAGAQPRTLKARWLLRLPARDARTAAEGSSAARYSSWRSSSSKAASRSPARWSLPATRTARCRSSLRRVLTEDEVLVRNVPRIRDVEAMLAILERYRRARRAGAAPNEVSLCAAGVHATIEIERELRSRSAPRSCSPARCSRASAAP